LKNAYYRPSIMIKKIYEYFRSLSMLLISVLFASAAGAQTVGRIVATPALPLPRNTDLRQAAQDRQVFVDMWAKQVVVLLTDDTAAGGMTQRRFDMTDQTDCSIAYSVKTDSPGNIRYTYTVQPTHSGRSAGHLTIHVPEKSRPQNAPGLLPFGTQATTIPNHHAPEPGNLQAISWNADANSQLDGLTVGLTSNYLPGITEAFLQSKPAHPLTAEDINSFPPAIATQLQPFLEPWWSSNRILVLAPMFPPNAPQRWIAANYHVAIRMLARRGALNSTSPSVTDLLASLGTYLANDADAPFPEIPSTAAGTPLEQTILTAIHIAFGQ
jgi:hypothetical protein